MRSRRTRRSTIKHVGQWSKAREEHGTWVCRTISKSQSQGSATLEKYTLCLQ